MEYFVTCSDFDERVLKEIKSLVMPESIKVLSFLFWLFALISGAIGIIDKDGSYIFMGLLLLVLGFVYYVLVYKISTKIGVKRIRETTETGQYVFRNSFTEEGFRITNETLGGSVSLSYDKIKKITVGQKHIAVLTKAKQYGLVNRVELIHRNEEREFMQFIAERCPNAKIK